MTNREQSQEGDWTPFDADSIQRPDGTWEQTKVIGICRNPHEPFYWDAEAMGDPCPGCSEHDDEGEPWPHEFYVQVEPAPKGQEGVAVPENHGRKTADVVAAYREREPAPTENGEDEGARGQGWTLYVCECGETIHHTDHHRIGGHEFNGQAIEVVPASELDRAIQERDEATRKGLQGFDAYAKELRDVEAAYQSLYDAVTRFLEANDAYVNAALRGSMSVATYREKANEARAELTRALASQREAEGEG